MSFLGLTLDPDWPSDLKYCFKLLSSKDNKEFFKGLKILVSIHKYNISKKKIAVTSKLLNGLEKIIPSYVKAAGEEYVINKTKMDLAIKQGNHPMDLRQKIAKMRANRNTSEQDPGTSTSESDIKILEIQDPMAGKGLVVKKFTREGKEIQKEVIPGSNLDKDVGDSGDEWVDASIFRNVPDVKFLFDKDGRIKETLEEGLSLLNPIVKEQSLDLNVSSATTGYVNPYDDINKNTSHADVVTHQTLHNDDDYINLENIPGLAYRDIGKEESKRCTMGDGDITPAYGQVISCIHCGAIFHWGCVKVVLEIESAICPACKKSWY
ncbi:hypothetical protein GF325_08845 [Candidatus Bathyarchaeota archaeon]|nr:hypothetical protein [Candidatus Bathyarchaeota archaeon]